MNHIVFLGDFKTNFVTAGLVGFRLSVETQHHHLHRICSIVNHVGMIVNGEPLPYVLHLGNSVIQEFFILNLVAHVVVLISFLTTGFKWKKQDLITETANKLHFEISCCQAFVLPARA
jgi:hypothetical protein